MRLPGYDGFALVAESSRRMRANELRRDFRPLHCAHELICATHVGLGEPGLEMDRRTARLTAMNFILAVLVYLVMGVVIGLGILAAVKGSLWLLIISLLVFIVLFGKIG